MTNRISLDRRFTATTLIATLIANLSAALSPSIAQARVAEEAKSSPRPSPTSAREPSAEKTLTLEEFLGQVETQNDGFRRSAKAVEGFDSRSDEWRLMTSPYMFGSMQTSVDKRETSSPAFMGTETSAQAFSIGVGQKSRYGLDSKLYYNFTDTSIKGANTGLLLSPEFVNSGPVLELSQSLWRNGFGRETRANQDAAAADVLARKFSEVHTQSQIRAQAESAYWRLAVARATLKATQESLQRAERSRSWSAEQAKLRLADQAELIQAEAAVASRQMQVQQAEAEAQAATRDFNTVRGVDSDEVTERLLDIDDSLIRSLKIPERTEVRADVKAAEQQTLAVKSASEAATESSKPAVDLFVGAGLTGRDPEASTSVAESFSSSHPNYSVGVRINFPLQQGIAARAREGHRAQAASQDLAYRRKVFEAEREWNELQRRFEEAKTRLTLAKKLENAQKSKLESERTRYRRGRTTTYQVILFEEDYANSQLSRIRMEAEILGIHSQMKVFGGAQ